MICWDKLDSQHGGNGCVAGALQYYDIELSAAWDLVKMEFLTRSVPAIGYG